MSILIVDDSPDDLILTEHFLKKGGYTDILKASSAREAFGYLGIELPEPSLPSIDLILLDVVMPDMDGIEACRRIRANGSFQDIPVIMATSLNDHKSLQMAFDAGANDYITKPLSYIELIARVRSSIKLKHETDNRKAREKELEELNKTLSQHIEDIKTLRGLIPICSSCKKIRDEKGFWESVEVYVTQHSEAEFTHSICDDCMKKLYPEFYQKIIEKKG